MDVEKQPVAKAKKKKKKKKKQEEPQPKNGSSEHNGDRQR